MTSQAFSRWGRHSDQYYASYSLDVAKQRATLTSDLEIEAQAAIQQICKLAKETRSLNKNNEVEKITLSTLESVLKLCADPDAFRHLACPPLISGCIKLMETIRMSGKPSVSIT